MSEVVAAPDGYKVCPACGHHTSAYASSCTAFVRVGPDAFEYCGCDCRVVMGGPSLETLVAGWFKNTRSLVDEDDAKGCE